MAGLEELTSALDETLRARGVDAAIKARLRAEVFGVLEGQGGGEGQGAAGGSGGPAAAALLVERAPQPSNETLVVNELIKEYLAFNGYKHTLSVFGPESGQPRSEDGGVPRAVLARELNLDVSLETRAPDGARRPLPLLYSCVEAMRKGLHQRLEDEDQAR